MSEAKKNEEDEKEKPPGVMEDGDISHHGNGNKKYNPTLSSKESIGDMTTV